MLTNLKIGRGKGPQARLPADNSDRIAHPILTCINTTANLPQAEADAAHRSTNTFPSVTAV